MTTAALVQIVLPPLHKGRDILTPCIYCRRSSPGQGGQDAIRRSLARFKVVRCGRRYGKTTLGVALCVEGAINKPGIYWWVAPTHKIARVGWRMLKRLAHQIPDCETYEGEKYIIFPGGGEVYIMSANDEGALRGEGVSGAVIDEADDVRETSWVEELLPALTDKEGWCLFIGTPKGRWFTQLYDRCAQWPDWERWHFWTENNPYIKQNLIERAREIMTPDQFEQEFHANVQAGKYLVYPNFSREMHRWYGPMPKFVRYFGGLDFGGDSIGNHKSAGVFAGMTEDGILIALGEFEQSGPSIAERHIQWIGQCEDAVRQNAERDGRNRTLMWFADKTQFFGIQIMIQAGIRIHPSKGGKDSVREGVGLVQRRIEFRNVGARSGLPQSKFYYLPHLRHLPDRLENYREHPPSPDRQTLRNPLKIDDDLMDAFRYMVEGADLLVLGDPMKLYRNSLAVVA